MGIGQLCRFFNVLDQIGPGRGKTLVGLRACTTFNQCFHHASGRDLLPASVENLLLKLRDQGIGLIGQLDRQLRHQFRNLYLICSTWFSTQPIQQFWIQAVAIDHTPAKSNGMAAGGQPGIQIVNLKPTSRNDTGKRRHGRGQLAQVVKSKRTCREQLDQRTSKRNSLAELGRREHTRNQQLPLLPRQLQQLRVEARRHGISHVEVDDSLKGLGRGHRRSPKGQSWMACPQGSHQVRPRRVIDPGDLNVMDPCRHQLINQGEQGSLLERLP